VEEERGIVSVGEQWFFKWLLGRTTAVMLSVEVF